MVGDGDVCNIGEGSFRVCFMIVCFVFVFFVLFIIGCRVVFVFG